MSVTRGAALASLVYVAACAAQNDLSSQVTAAEAAEASQRDQTERLRVDAAQLANDYAAVTEQLRLAEAQFRVAEATAERASVAWSSAATSYTETERNWRWMNYVVLAAATWDLGDAVCAGVESTAQYRRRLGLVGNKAICIDHSFAHALGGINHAWNYVPLDCRLNSAYGAAFWSKLADMPIDVLQGLAVSAIARLRCGGMASAWRR